MYNVEEKGHEVRVGARGTEKEHTPKAVQKLDATDQLNKRGSPTSGVLPLPSLQ